MIVVFRMSCPKDQDLIMGLTLLAGVVYDRATEIVTDMLQSTKSLLV